MNKTIETGETQYYAECIEAGKKSLSEKAEKLQANGYSVEEISAELNLPESIVRKYVLTN